MVNKVLRDIDIVNMHSLGETRAGTGGPFTSQRRLQCSLASVEPGAVPSGCWCHGGCYMTEGRAAGNDGDMGGQAAAPASNVC